MGCLFRVGDMGCIFLFKCVSFVIEGKGVILMVHLP